MKTLSIAAIIVSIISFSFSLYVYTLLKSNEVIPKVIHNPNSALQEKCLAGKLSEAKGSHCIITYNNLLWCC